MLESVASSMDLVSRLGRWSLIKHSPADSPPTSSHTAEAELGCAVQLPYSPRKLLPPRPPDHGFRDLAVLLIRQGDCQQEGFPWSHWQVSRDPPAGTREIPDYALASKGTSVLRNGALHRKAAVGTNREKHGSFTGRRIVGGWRRETQGRFAENMDVFLDERVGRNRKCAPSHPASPSRRKFHKKRFASFRTLIPDLSNKVYSTIASTPHLHIAVHGLSKLL